METEISSLFSKESLYLSCFEPEEFCLILILFPHLPLQLVFEFVWYSSYNLLSRLSHLLRCKAKGKAIRFPDSRHMKVVRLAALSTDRIYTQKILLVLISVWAWVDSRSTVRPEELIQWKSQWPHRNFEPVTFQLVGQCLNQLRHHVPLFFYGIVLSMYSEDKNLWINLGINSRKWYRVIFRIENYLYFVRLSTPWAGFVSFTLEITCRQDARWQAAELKAGLVE
jgi:hypothetical protein